MCGICGFTGFRDEGLLKRMTDILTHRGPDECGYFTNDEVSLGHRRLSIIDLNTGRQPLFNEDRTVCVVYNGEIYNYLDVGGDLRTRGHKFITSSDTEVIVHLYEELGIDCVKRLNGMFAFALWDEHNKRLLIARDRLGIKPLYYALLNNKLIFASEMKSILEYEGFSRSINLKALDKYLLLRYVPDETTLLRGIFKLPPATTLVYENGKVKFNNYWQLEMEEDKRLKEREYIDAFRSLFERVVKEHLISDVSFGAFLSGGIDSASVVGMMSKFISGRIKTFSIGFNLDIDEFPAAKNISRSFNTDHTEILVDSQSYRLLPKIMWHLDEPVGDSIIIPIYLLSQETSKHVKMVLTGEGADEIFGSYVHQVALYFGQLYNRVLPLPGVFKNALSKGLRLLPVWLLDKFFPYPAFLGKEGKDKLINYLSFLDDGVSAYLSLASVFDYKSRERLYTKDIRCQLSGLKDGSVRKQFGNVLFDSKNSLFNNVIALDLRYWLSNYTLTKLDRLSMANSLEGRVPFLDHRLVELSTRMPVSMKMRGFSTKYLLRKSMEGLLPKETTRAPKKAFYFPTEQCFDAGFAEFLNDSLSESAIRKRGIFNYAYVKELIKDTRSPELLTNKRIMSLLILEIWMKEFLG